MNKVPNCPVEFEIESLANNNGGQCGTVPGFEICKVCKQRGTWGGTPVAKAMERIADDWSRGIIGEEMFNAAKRVALDQVIA